MAGAGIRVITIPCGTVLLAKTESRYNGDMRLHVLFFGPLAEQMGCREEDLELAGPLRAADVYAHYQSRCHAMGELGRQLLLAVNQEFVSPEQLLQDADEIAFLPPMSGGSEAVRSQPPHRVVTEIVRHPIDCEALQAQLKSGCDGAVVLFDGIVRDHSGDRSTAFLEYEAYEPMALKQMQALGEQALHTWAIDSIGIVHRLGRLEIGESSVVIVVTAAHRRPAFEACRFAIDELKRSVPIWKKETGSNGSFWVEGEFPSQPVAAAEENQH